MHQQFAGWLETLRSEVAAIRASKGNKDSNHKPDKRLDSVLPIQFEHEGRLRWSSAAHSAAMWSALWELAFYACCGVAILAVLVRRWVPGWLWVALVLGIAVTWLVSRFQRRRERPAEQWRAEADVVPGALVYANEALLRDGPEPASNAGFVFTFDPELGADPDRLVDLARRVAELQEEDAEPASDLRELHRRSREWTEDRTPDDPHTFDRVRIPRVLCGNDITYMAMVAVARDELQGGVVDRRIYPLLARRDRNESAALLPLSVWGGDEA